MKKIVRLTESELVRLVKRVIEEQPTPSAIKTPKDFILAGSVGMCKAIPSLVKANSPIIFDKSSGNASIDLFIGFSNGIPVCDSAKNPTREMVYKMSNQFTERGKLYLNCNTNNSMDVSYKGEERDQMEVSRYDGKELVSFFKQNFCKSR